MRSLLIGLILVAGGVYALPAEPALEAAATPPDSEDTQDRTLKMAVLSIP